MMKIVFVDLLHLYYDPHGIYALAGALRNRDTRLFYLSARRFSALARQLQQIEPDLLCYSSFSAVLPLYMAFDKMIKQSLSVTSVIGGAGPTFDWAALRQSTIDAVCVGEGEYALRDFIQNDFQSAGNVFRREDPFPRWFYPLVDMDRLPFPDRSVVYRSDRLLRESPSKQFFSGRGCPYHCSYCFNHQFREMFQGCGPLVRKKSVDYLLAEIKAVRKDYPLQELIFNDDIFILDKDWFLEFCQRYPREVGLPYTCNVRANLLDEEIAAGLRESGCQGVNWAIETGNQQLRNTILRRNMTDEQIYEAAGWLKKYRIRFRTGNIIGLPGEDIACIQETIAMNIRVRPDLGLANIFIPFPGLKLTQYAMEQGCCRQPAIGDLPRDYFSRSMLNFSPQEKRRIYKLFCLFPFFVQWPALFQRQRVRRLLLALPKTVLRLCYEPFYTVKMARLCIPRTPFRIRLRMALRHLKNL